MGINNQPIARNPPALPSFGCKACKRPTAAVTSYTLGTLVHTIDLRERLMTAGLNREEAVAFLRTRPTVRFSVWCASYETCLMDQQTGTGVADKLIAGAELALTAGQEVWPVLHFSHRPRFSPSRVICPTFREQLP